MNLPKTQLVEFQIWQASGQPRAFGQPKTKYF